MKHHFFIGIDRSDQTIDIALLDSKGQLIKQDKVDSSPESLQLWVSSIREDLPDGSTAAICIEQPCKNLTSFFREFDFLLLYLINPSLLKNYLKSLSSTTAKDDKRDSLGLARMLFERHRELAPWKPSDTITEQLSELTTKRRQLVDMRADILRKLQQTLKDYYPQALQLVGRDLHTPLATDFLNKWPSLQTLQKSRPETIRKFYYLHRSSRAEVVDKRLQIIADAVPLCLAEHLLVVSTELILSFVKQLQTLRASIKRFDKLIEKATAEHSNTPIFKSLPGAGPAFTARLLAFFGTDHTAFESAASIQKVSGVAPVTKQSGKMCYVHRRYGCNKFWRQSFVEWAGQTVNRSIWAKAYYEQQKAKGKRHQSILRGLAYKWQRILFRLWKSNEVYSENHYLKALEKSGSPLVQVITQLKQQQQKECEQI